MKKLTKAEQKKLYMALPAKVRTEFRRKLGAAADLEIKQRKMSGGSLSLSGGSFVSFFKKIWKKAAPTLGAVGKTMLPFVRDELLLPILRQRVKQYANKSGKTGKGISVTGSGLRLTGGSKKPRKRRRTKK